MKREERKIYTRCIAIMAAYIIAGVYFYTLPCDAKFDPLEAFEETDGNFTEETEKVAKTGQIREDTGISGMPCESPEQFARFLETYEQETGEESETATDEILSNGEETGESDVESVPSEMGIEVETETESRPVYSVNGETLNPELQRYLYSRLQEFGCEWFFRYSLCQLYQESRYDSNAVGKSGLDCGLCQFRYPYFPSVAEEAGLVEYDIFNPIDSIYVYTYLMCKYLNETGGDVAMSLSLYYSGYGGPYSSEYVRDVTQWFETMKEVEQ